MRLAEEGLIQQCRNASNDRYVCDVEDVPVVAEGMQREEIRDTAEP